MSCTERIGKHNPTCRNMQILLFEQAVFERDTKMKKAYLMAIESKILITMSLYCSIGR